MLYGVRFCYSSSLQYKTHVMATTTCSTPDARSACAAAGAIYAWFKRSELGAYLWHLAVLIYLLALVLNLLTCGQPESLFHWLCGLGLFSFLLLPLKTAFNFNLSVLIGSSLVSLFNYDFSPCCGSQQVSPCW